MCVTPAFRASCASKVRGPPPDMPSPGSLPTTCFSDFSFSQPQQPLRAPSPLLHLGLLLGCSAPNPLGSEPHPQIDAHLSLAQLAL